LNHLHYPLVCLASNDKSSLMLSRFCNDQGIDAQTVIVNNDNCLGEDNIQDGNMEATKSFLQICPQAFAKDRLFT